MIAVRVHQFGEADVLIPENVDGFSPGPREIVVSLKAAGVNPVDAYIRSGQYALKPPLPYTPGFDGAGVVKTVGGEVKAFHPGERVFVVGSLSGTYAEEALCLPEHLYPLPENISFEEGAAVGVPYATAYRALFSKARAVDGETVLVHGASGGVGNAAIQIAKQTVLKVIATAGSERGLKIVRDLGADEVLDHSRPGYLEQLGALTGGKGVDIVLEMLANVNLGEDLKHLAAGGRVVVIGSRGPVTINPRDLMGRDASIMGMALLNVDYSQRKKIYMAVLDGLKGGKLKPVIGRTLRLADAKNAHKMIFEPGAYGKIILTIDQ